MSERTADRSRIAGKPRRPRWWRNLMADPVRKLLALALAILLWIFLDSQISESKGVKFKLIGERMAKEETEAEIRDSHIVVHPPAGYRIVGFRDHMTAAPIKDDTVEVTFEAARNYLRNILSDPSLSVRPRQEEMNPRASTVMFDMSELQAPDYAVVKAIRDMKPRRVDAVLERVDERPVALDKSFVKVVYPEDSRDFQERLRLDAASFAPPQVTLQGPRSVTETAHTGVPIFLLDLSNAGGVNEPKIVAALTAIPPQNVTILGGPVTITIPLDPRFEQYDILVPVLVDQTCRSTQADDFEYDQALPVTLFVSGELAGILSRMKDASELNTWAKRSARVIVQLDDSWHHDAQLLAGMFLLLEPRYERGRHFRTSPAALQVQIRPKVKNG